MNNIWNHPSESTNNNREFSFFNVAPIETTNERLLNSLQKDKSILLQDWEKINILEISEEYQNLCKVIIEKYWFSEDEIIKFKRSIILHLCESDPKNSILRWSCNKKIRNDLFIPIWEIYLNTDLIDNRNLYFAVLFHEIDHYAFFFKKFFEKRNEDISSAEWRQNAINLIEQEDWSEYFRFNTELIARIDTADMLMSKWIPWDKVWEYWPWDEYYTTWEAHYSESILYAKKFLNFQIWLYNLLWDTFGLDGSKPKNKQLIEVADKQFQTIMNRLRNEIFNSPSIERSKNVIDESYRKLQESGWSWDAFCSLRK